MRKTVFLIIFALVAAVSNPVGIFAADYDIKFGLLKKDKQGRYYVYKQTTNLSLIYKDKDPEYRFGYTITGPADTAFTTFAVMYFPSNIQQFNDDEKMANRKTVQLPSKESVNEFAYSFRFDKGDPPGQYKLVIFVNDKLEQTFVFNVQE